VLLLLRHPSPDLLPTAPWPSRVLHHRWLSTLHLNFLPLNFLLPQQESLASLLLLLTMPSLSVSW
jgi:hypothetical protein